MQAKTARKRPGIVTRLGIVGELLQHLWQRKLWWLIPMLLVMLLVVGLLVFTQSSAIAPFIYSLF